MLGRHCPGITYTLLDKLISRKHASINYSVEGKMPSLTDLGSLNGTSVNRMPLTPHVPHLLKAGDVVMFGTVQNAGLVYEVHQYPDGTSIPQEGARRCITSTVGIDVGEGPVEVPPSHNSLRVLYPQEQSLQSSSGSGNARRLKRYAHGDHSPNGNAQIWRSEDPSCVLIPDAESPLSVDIPQACHPNPLDMTSASEISPRSGRSSFCSRRNAAKELESTPTDSVDVSQGPRIPFNTSNRSSAMLFTAKEGPAISFAVDEDPVALDDAINSGAAAVSRRAKRKASGSFQLSDRISDDMDELEPHPPRTRQQPSCFPSSLVLRHPSIEVTRGAVPPSSVASSSNSIRLDRPINGTLPSDRRDIDDVDDSEFLRPRTRRRLSDTIDLNHSMLPPPTTNRIVPKSEDQAPPSSSSPAPLIKRSDMLGMAKSSFEAPDSLKEMVSPRRRVPSAAIQSSDVVDVDSPEVLNVSRRSFRPTRRLDGDASPSSSSSGPTSVSRRSLIDLERHNLPRISLTPLERYSESSAALNRLESSADGVERHERSRQSMAGNSREGYVESQSIGLNVSDEPRADAASSSSCTRSFTIDETLNPSLSADRTASVESSLPINRLSTQATDNAMPFLGALSNRNSYHSNRMRFSAEAYDEQEEVRDPASGPRAPWPHLTFDLANRKGSFTGNMPERTSMPGLSLSRHLGVSPSSSTTTQPLLTSVLASSSSAPSSLETIVGTSLLSTSAGASSLDASNVSRASQIIDDLLEMPKPSEPINLDFPPSQPSASSAKGKERALEENSVKEAEERGAARFVRDKLLEQFACAICFDTMVCPQTINPCGHAFCGECIEGWIQSGKRTCPNCRQSITRKLIPHVSLQAIIEATLPQLGLTDEEIREREDREKAFKEKRARTNGELPPAIPQPPPRTALDSWLARGGDRGRGGGGQMAAYLFQPENGNRMNVADASPPGRVRRNQEATPAEIRGLDVEIAVSRARSGRTQCVTCRNPIVRHSVKLLLKVYGMRSPSCHHPVCIREQIPSRYRDAPSNISGYVQLGPEEQLRLVQAIRRSLQLEPNMPNNNDALLAPPLANASTSHRRASSFDAYDAILEKVVSQVSQGMAMRSTSKRIDASDEDGEDDEGEGDEEEEEEEKDDEFSWEVSDDETLPEGTKTESSIKAKSSTLSSQRVSPIPFRADLDAPLKHVEDDDDDADIPIHRPTHHQPTPSLPHPPRHRTTTELLAERPTTEEQEALFNEELRKAKMLVELHERVFGGGGNEDNDEGDDMVGTVAAALTGITTETGLQKRGEALARALEALSVKRRVETKEDEGDEVVRYGDVGSSVRELEEMGEVKKGAGAFKMSKGSRGFERFIPTGVPTFGGLSRLTEVDDE
ncbi:hypothetical protein HDU67_007801 [Dinochytrium kinnereticum]|nr:hypothetical protein HDU67_007801 [Dinochytrium kinnereticum]